MADFKIDSKHPSRVIDGTKFLHGFDREGAASSDIETNRYRGFKNGKCYDLAMHVAYGDLRCTIREQSKSLQGTISSWLRKN